MAGAPASLLFWAETAYFFQVRYLYVLCTAEVRLIYGGYTVDRLLMHRCLSSFLAIPFYLIFLFTHRTAQTYIQKEAVSKCGCPFCPFCPKCPICPDKTDDPDISDK